MTRDLPLDAAFLSDANERLASKIDVVRSTQAACGRNPGKRIGHHPDQSPVPKIDELLVRFTIPKTWQSFSATFGKAVLDCTLCRFP
jgi:hypothetical protein